MPKAEPAKPNSTAERVVTKSGGIECGECGGMFPDPPTASKHIAKCKGAPATPKTPKKAKHAKKAA